MTWDTFCKSLHFCKKQGLLQGFEPTIGSTLNRFLFTGPGKYDPSPVKGYTVDQKSAFLGTERFFEGEGRFLWDVMPHLYLGLTY